MTMKLMDSYRDIICETQGMSHQVWAWVNVLSNIIKNSKTNKIEVNGHEYPRAYREFDVDKFYISIIPNVGHYDENKSGYKDGLYTVYLIMPNNHNFRNALAHELRHAFDDYNRISKGKPRLSQRKEVKQFLAKDFEDLYLGRLLSSTGEQLSPKDFPIFSPILMALYKTSKTEETAYAETVYSGADYVIDSLKKLTKLDLIQDIRKISPVTLKKEWELFRNNVKLPIVQNFTNYMDFVKWADKRIRKRSNYALKKLLKVKYYRDHNKHKIN